MNELLNVEEVTCDARLTQLVRHKFCWPLRHYVICKPDLRGGSHCATSFVGCFLENLFLKSRLRSLTTATILC
jgi:hypothetical protein